MIPLLDRYQRRYFRTFFEQFLHRKIFKGIENHCVFIGYPRSGHTLTASLLDAHPNISISKGVDALQYLEQGFKLSQIYCLYLRHAKRFAKSEGKSNGYDYLVKNQWNGKFSELKIIGDKSGDLLTERLRTNPNLLQLILMDRSVRHKFIHVIRNPFDSIATYSNRTHVSLDQATNYYFSLCATVTSARKEIHPDNWIDVNHEQLVGDPHLWISKLCMFLGQSSSNSYLKDCADIVFKSPAKTRNTVSWTQNQIFRIKTELKKYPYLSEYTFEN